MAKKLYFITGNRHKVDEISRILLPIGIELVSKDLKIPEGEFDSIEKVAIDKAKQAFAILKKPLIAEDTGVFFSAYKNFPGIYTKRMYSSLGFKGLLKLLHGENRKGLFQSSICFIWKKNSCKVFTGKLYGKFAEKVFEKKADRLPYEKIFKPNVKKTVLVKIPIDEKNKFSHRAIASKKLKEFLKNSLEKQLF